MYNKQQQGQNQASYSNLETRTSETYSPKSSFSLWGAIKATGRILGTYLMIKLAACSGVSVAPINNQTNPKQEQPAPKQDKLKPQDLEKKLAEQAKKKRAEFDNLQPSGNFVKVYQAQFKLLEQARALYMKAEAAQEGDQLSKELADLDAYMGEFTLKALPFAETQEAFNEMYAVGEK